jgi:hypothetical protein
LCLSFQRRAPPCPPARVGVCLCLESRGKRDKAETAPKRGNRSEKRKQGQALQKGKGSRQGGSPARARASHVGNLRDRS